MGNGDNGTLILLKVLLQPIDTLGIEVVGRLIQQKHIGLLQQQTTQSNSTTLTTREHLDTLVSIGASQSIHSTLQDAVKLPAVDVVNLLVELALTLDKAIHLIVRERLTELHINLLVLLQQSDSRGTSLLDNLLNGLRVIQLRLLLEVANRVARREDNLTLEILVDAGNNLHQGRLTRAIQTDDTNLGTIEE